MDNKRNFPKRLISIDCNLKESLSLLFHVESQTIIHCKIKANQMFQHGGWANISPNTYLINRQSSERLKLIYAENIPYTPHRHLFSSTQASLSFILVFQKIPETWTTFSLYEETAFGDGFFVGDIPRNKSCIYRIRIN